MSNLFQVLDSESDTNIENEYQEVDEDNNNTNDVIEAAEVDEEKDDSGEPKIRKPNFMPPEQEQALLDQLKKFINE